MTALRTLKTDFFYLLIGAFLLIIVMLVLLINIPGTNETKEDRARSELVVQLIWSTEGRDSPYRDADIDLWVQGPADIGPVGFKSKNGVQFSLLRDIVGGWGNLAPFNQEITLADRAVPGEYTINTHLYARRNAPLPIPFTVVVTLNRKGGKKRGDILSFEGELTNPNQEMTIFNFTLTEDYDVNDVNRVYRPLYKPTGPRG